MSLRVLVIPEDPTHNGYLLRPLAQAIVSDVGRGTARVHVVTNPRLGGFDAAVRAIREELPSRYGFWDLWLFFPDADRASPAAMSGLETDLAAQGIRLFTCRAEPEVEIYPCAAYLKVLGRPWDSVRADRRLKEDVFAPLLRKFGDARRAGGGRDLMMEEALRNRTRLYRLCPELRELRERIAKFLSRPRAPGQPG